MTEPKHLTCKRCGATRGEHCATPSGRPTARGSHWVRIAEVRALRHRRDARQRELFTEASHDA